MFQWNMEHLPALIAFFGMMMTVGTGTLALPVGRGFEPGPECAAGCVVALAGCLVLAHRLLPADAPWHARVIQMRVADVDRSGVTRIGSVRRARSMTLQESRTAPASGGYRAVRRSLADCRMRPAIKRGLNSRARFDRGPLNSGGDEAARVPIEAESRAESPGRRTNAGTTWMHGGVDSHSHRRSRAGLEGAGSLKPIGTC